MIFPETQTENPNTRKIFDRNYYLDRAHRLNEDEGQDMDGYNCPKCNNKGYFYSVRGDDGKDEIVEGVCPECGNIRQSIRFLKMSGLENKTFDNFTAKSLWQKDLCTLVRAYTSEPNGKWLFLGGQSGCGKTHLCTAALREIVLAHNKQLTVLKWVEASRLLKGLVNDGGYTGKADKYKRAELLYIDDLFKVGGKSISNADIRLAFEILDYRYLKGLQTVISSEFSLDEIITADEAVGGRIKEKAGRYTAYIKRDREKNYRLK